MKRIAALAIVLLLLFSLGLPAFADLDDGDFDQWYIRCGPAGFSFVDTPYYDTDPNADLHDYLEPGTRLWVHSFDKDTKKYLVVISDDNHEIKGTGHLLVTEAQLNKYFVGEKQAFSTKYVPKLDKPVDCIVTPSVGLVLRQGPDVNYPSFRTIPQNTKLTYQHVYKGEQYNWGYVTYKGQGGWCCLKYTKAVEAATEASTETTAETTTEPATETTTEPTTEPTTKAATEPTTAVTTEPTVPEEQTTVPDAKEAEGFFDSTANVILVCCLGAVILALTAVVILLLVKRKKA